MLETLARCGAGGAAARAPLGHLLQAADLRLSRSCMLFVGLGWLGGTETSRSRGKHTALVELNGVIAAEREASAESINAGAAGRVQGQEHQGVICASTARAAARCRPGTSTTKSAACAASIPKIPLYVVVEDICASGGYYVAAAADKIYVDKASIVGSIGVLMDGFGFTGTMEKLGVERRAAHGGREQGLPRSVLAAESEAEASIAREDADRDPPAVHRRGAARAAASA